jgi:hypothetical protein
MQGDEFFTRSTEFSRSAVLHAHPRLGIPTIEAAVGLKRRPAGKEACDSEGLLLGRHFHFHFHFGIQISNDVLESLDRLLDRRNLHQLPVLDRTVPFLKRNDQIPSLLLKLNKR